MIDKQLDVTEMRLGEVAPLPDGRGRRLAGALTRDTKLTIGGVLVGASVLMAIFAPLLAPHSPTEPDATAALLAPSAAHLFGTDALGLDVFSRVIYAMRTDLVVPVVAVAVSFAIGVPAGAWMGYYSGSGGVRGWLAEHSMRVLDILQAFPLFVLALALTATLGRDPKSVVYALIVMAAPVLARLTRSSVQSVRSSTYVEAARVAGSTEGQIVFRHVLPNALGPPLVQVSILTGGGILLTAGLSFVGAGVQLPNAELGLMVSTGAENIITGQWWPALFPGIFIALLVLGFALLGEALGDSIRREER